MTNIVHILVRDQRGYLLRNEVVLILFDLSAEESTIWLCSDSLPILFKAMKTGVGEYCVSHIF